MDIGRREFLKQLGSSFYFLLFCPNLLNAQVSKDNKEDWLTNELKEKIRKRREEALNPRPPGYGLHGNQRFSIDLDEEQINMNIRFEYYGGIKGSGGVLRTFVYLDEKDWYSKKGIKRLQFILYSPYEVRFSRRVYEVNLNRHYGLVTHSPLEHVVLEGDYLTKKITESVFAVLKKIKIDKKDVDQAIWVKNMFRDLKDNEIIQRIIEKGNEITGESVYIKMIEYNGYGLLDDKNLEGKLRAPKLVRYEILKGEANIEAAGLLAEVVDFKDEYLGKKVFGTRTVKGNASHFWRFPVKDLIKGIKIENVEEETKEPDEF
ncbi:MAG: hypothetical protein QW622_03300 [Candidatus Pacearchaeota archaeon]